MKPLFLLTMLIVAARSGRTQTLFSFGPHTVSREEFLRAWQRNNQPGSERSPQAYLDLYIPYRLKVQAALDAGMDTLPEQVQDAKAFREQVSAGYLKEDASIQMMVEEALPRLRQDIHLSHILVPLPEGAPEEEILRAGQEARDLHARLEQDPAMAALPAGRRIPGSHYSIRNLGFVTAFGLPYALENIAYTTPVGRWSSPVFGPGGFHLFRPDSTRPARGTVRIAQILLAFPPGQDTAVTRRTLQAKADSLCRLLRNGANFGELAATYSDDGQSFRNGGELPAFGVGRYDTAFEQAAFSLTADDEISDPVETAFGWHILQRLQRIPVPEDDSHPTWRAMVREKVLASDRMQQARDLMTARIRDAIRNDFPNADGAPADEVLAYYQEHLERYQPEFAAQLEDFRQGNLLFAMMQEKIWQPAEDSSALMAFYDRHRNRYQWKNSGDAIIVTCPYSLLPRVMQALQEDPASWRELSARLEAALIVDSGRFELNELPPVPGPTEPGRISAPLIQSPDSSATIVYLLSRHADPSPKSFADARGAVMSDYQIDLEEAWLADLRKKYPVRINRRVLRSLEKGLQ